MGTTRNSMRRAEVGAVMSKSVNIEMNGEEEVEFSASISTDGDVEDLYVGVIIKGTSIRIEHLLNSKQRDYFEERIIQEASDLEENEKDAAAEQKFEEMRDERLGK
jgi:hypothetical protein